MHNESILFQEWSIVNENVPGKNTVLESVPSGQPQLVKPSFEKTDLETLQSDLPKMKEFMINAKDRDWYDQFITECHQRGECNTMCVVNF